MRNTIIILVSILVIGGGFVALSGGNDEQTVTSQATASTSPLVVNDSESGETQTAASGQYINYSETAIKENKGKNKIVFFHADWCINCQGLERNVLAGSIPDDVVILKANYDSDTDLKQKYGVTYQTSLVQIDDAGEPLKLWIGTYNTGISDIVAELI